MSNSSTLKGLGVKLDPRQFNKEAFAVFKAINNDGGEMIAEMKKNPYLRKGREFN